ncbi:2 4-dienoyl-CoA reductase NADPH [Paramagnetospirillum magnetotacticum MS-1]|uniref:2 4-dienoyl-CoA reductase NADPH n=1 Tax=Paramagnetospirillum magnetotacticum MS-1 TaxID=272627 RepID=A0A0C2V2U3_PARME|nr:NADH:flavin oxidoreductase/NADH oxidase [Paramagnetospirillum magnetotacticum]KIL99406.1 2 4-dienoyl-CoA reductase NADPH [Paramagnetospirillum magnetotacticum MS-1]
MTQPHLFQPLSLRGLTLPNRVAVAPMCQYSAKDGVVQDWHLMHYGSLAASGPGMVVIEATGVTPEGRISPKCLGLYDDATEAGFIRLVAAIKGFGGNGAIGVQLGHAGRKGGAAAPWEGGKFSPDGWQTISASDIAFDEGWPSPKAATIEDLDRLKQAFVIAAQRALRIGFDFIELHSAHGYLLHQFLSPLSNRRDDQYGGSLENRMRFPLEVITAVRAVWPADKPLGLRISATDWVEGGWDADQAVNYAKAFKAAGIDFVCVSSGGLVSYAKVPVGPGYQIELAARIRREAGIPTRAVGLIATPHQAETALTEGAADLIAIGRGFLDNPRWVWHAAQALGAQMTYPPQYLAAGTRAWPGVALARPTLAAE